MSCDKEQSQQQLAVATAVWMHPLKCPSLHLLTALDVRVCCCCCSNQPTDVVKVRLQAEGRLPAGATRRYNGAIDAYRKIISQEGVLGLWTGYGPNLARNCVVNATELVAYDQAKQIFLANGMPDNVPTHILSGLSAGLAATLLGSPVDVIKVTITSALLTLMHSQSCIDTVLPRRVLTYSSCLYAVCVVVVVVTDPRDGGEGSRRRSDPRWSGSRA